jgi:predicted metal-dependent hydrolase
MAKNSSTEIICHPRLGPICILQNPSVKNISIRLKSTGEIILTYPTARSKTRALSFLDTKTNWIIQRRKHFQSITQKFDLRLPIKTKLHEIRECNKTPESEQKNIIYIENSPQKSHEQHIEEIKLTLKKIWRKEAQLLLPERVEQIAQRFGFRYGRISLRACRTRWGSCSANNDISLNINLMQLPDELIDYIIIHELCHTVHKNHGSEFHNLVDKCTNGAEFELRKKLKNYTPLR